MRTTVTLDPDVEARLRRLAQERGASFKATLNATLRVGLEAGPGSRRGFEERTVALEVLPGVDLTKSLRLAAELEDEAVVRELELRK